MPKTKSKRNNWINVALVGVIAMMTVLVATFAGGTASGTVLGAPTPTATVTPTATATPTATPQPTATPTATATPSATAAPEEPTAQPDGGVGGAGDSAQDPPAGTQGAGNSTQEPDSLAYTGNDDNTGFVLLGIALVVAGAALVFTVRRGQRAEA